MNGGNIVSLPISKPPLRHTAVTTIDKSLQLTIYYLAAKMNNFADREILLRFDCFIKTKKPKFEQYYTSRNEDDIQRTTKKIQQVWKGIQKGVFIPNDTSWKCGFCSYKKQCNAWFMQDENILERGMRMMKNRNQVIEIIIRRRCSARCSFLQYH